MKEFVDFYFYLVEEEQEESLFEVWLHSQSEKSFEEFKKDVLKHQKPKRIKKKSNEAEQLKWAAKFIKPTGKVGEEHAR